MENTSAIENDPFLIRLKHRRKGPQEETGALSSELNFAPGGKHIREAGEDEILKLARSRAGDMAYRFRFAVSGESTCYIALAEGEPAGYTWTNRKMMMMMDLIRMPFPGMLSPTASGHFHPAGPSSS